MATVADDVFEDVLHEVLRLHHASTLQIAVDIGRLLVERFYGGDLAAVRARGEDDVTLKKLGERLTAEGTDLSATVLWRHLSLYELDRRIPLAGRKLTPTHVRAVFRLPPGEQEKLLDEAEAEGWTTRELEDEVEARFPSPTRRGRRQVPVAVQTARALWRRASDERSLDGLDAIAALPLATARRTLDQLGAVRAAIALLEAALNARLGSADAAATGGDRGAGDTEAAPDGGGARPARKKRGGGGGGGGAGDGGGRRSDGDVTVDDEGTDPSQYDIDLDGIADLDFGFDLGLSAEPEPPDRYVSARGGEAGGGAGRSDRRAMRVRRPAARARGPRRASTREPWTTAASRVQAMSPAAESLATRRTFARRTTECWRRRARRSVGSFAVVAASQLARPTTWP